MVSFMTVSEFNDVNVGETGSGISEVLGNGQRLVDGLSLPEDTEMSATMRLMIFSLFPIESSM